VYGNAKKSKIITPFNRIDSFFLRLVMSPTIAADVAAGRKSSPRKTGGAPVENAAKVPTVMDNGPRRGPSNAPKSGATMSPALKVAPGIPSIG